VQLAWRRLGYWEQGHRGLDLRNGRHDGQFKGDLQLAYRGTYTDVTRRPAAAASALRAENPSDNRRQLCVLPSAFVRDGGAVDRLLLQVLAQMAADARLSGFSRSFRSE